MFLVRPRPFEGESMSSWRQRAAIENGFKLFPNAPRENRRSDPDLSPSRSTLLWLSDEFDVPIERLEPLVFRGLKGRLLSFGSGRATPRWVLPLRYSRHDTSLGIPYCPLCLKEDKQPYFRLGWRLALSSACQNHRIRFNDRCSQCGRPAWPEASTIPALFSGAQYAVHICPVCGFDLRDAKPQWKESIAIARMSWDYLATNVALSASLSVKTSEFASALWVVCQLFIRTRSKTRVLHSDSPQGELARSLVSMKARSVEDLPINARHDLVETARSLFSEWPEAFSRFCARHGITAQDFSPDRAELPPWFNEVVDRMLARQVRGVTPDQVEAAKNLLLSKGEKITKVAVGRLVGSKEVSAVNKALGRRHQASPDEGLMLIRSLTTYMRQPMLRRSSVEIRMRDVLVLLIALMMKKELSEVVALPASEVEALAVSVSHQMPEDRLKRIAAELLHRAFRRYEKFRTRAVQKWGHEVHQEYFCARNGSRASPRSAQEALRECMAAQDSRLPRTVKAFFHLFS